MTVLDKSTYFSHTQCLSPYKFIYLSIQSEKLVLFFSISRGYGTRFGFLQTLPMRIQGHQLRVIEDYSLTLQEFLKMVNERQTENYTFRVVSGSTLSGTGCVPW